MRLYLIGFMGSGKSHVGKALAKKMQLQFVDLDDLIVSTANAPISSIFSEKGEEYFRQLEQRCLKETLHLQNTIVATGGGTPCFYDNMNWINQHGFSLFLDVAPSILIQRLEKEMEKRPLLAKLSKEEMSRFIHQKLEDRRSFYERAHIVYNQNTGTQTVVKDLNYYFLNIIGH